MGNVVPVHDDSAGLIHSQENFMSIVNVVHCQRFEFLTLMEFGKIGRSSSMSKR